MSYFLARFAFLSHSAAEPCVHTHVRRIPLHPSWCVGFPRVGTDMGLAPEGLKPRDRGKTLPLHVLVPTMPLGYTVRLDYA